MPTDRATAHRTVFDDVVHDMPGEVARHGKPDPLISARLAVDRRVDANELAACVDERAPGVSRVDRRIRLNEVLVRGEAAAEAPAGRADDAERDGLVELIGIAHREHPFRDLQLRRISPIQRRKIRRVDLQDGDVRHDVGANQFRLQLPLVGEHDADLVDHRALVAAAHDMVVREHVAVPRDHHTRSQTLFATVPVTERVVTEEELEERIARER